MNQAETMECLSLMGNLWSSFRVPETPEDIQVLTGIWLQFFGTIPQSIVSQTIMEIAAEGGEFAPQVGQIYERIKASNTPKLRGFDNPFIQLAFTAAKMEDFEPPAAADIQTVRAWWRDVYGLRRNHHGNDKG